MSDLEKRIEQLEYRRKPKPEEWYILEYKSGSIVTHKTYAGALLADSQNALIRVTRVIEDPTWVKQEPAMPAPTLPPSTPMNPWRPIIKGEWPECKPTDRIDLKLANMIIETGYVANGVNWNDTIAIEWKYAEDE